MGDYEFFIELPIHSEWKSIELIRASVQNCLTAAFPKGDASHLVAMIAGELLENAVKYGNWSGDKKSFRLRIRGSSEDAVITVANPVATDDANVDEVLRTIRWLETTASPADAYRAKLMEIASAADMDLARSGLGLARIAYEGNCRLHANLVEDVLHVTAEVGQAGRASTA
jgi:hypothetical protein